MMTDPNPDAIWFCTRCAFLGTAAEADAHAQPTHLLSPLRTRTGKIVTNEELNRWIDAVAHPGWTSRTCEICRGTGMVSRYSMVDFEGPEECSDCNGGTVWISPRGYYAVYPGGPFIGGRTSEVVPAGAGRRR